MWTPTKYDDHDTLHERFHQIPTTPIDYTDDFYDMTGDVTTNHTRITPPIDLISSTDGPDSFESAHPPVLDTPFDSSFLDNLDIPRPTEHDYWDYFFDATPSRIIYHSFLDSCLEDNISTSDIHDSVVAPRHTIASDIDFESKRKYFSYLPIDVIKATFKYTSQCMKLPPSTHLQKRFRSPNPGANLRRRYFIYSTVPSY
jgi:hypothetical protein